MKKNKRLILHIGTVKTGTSSIQESLGRSRNALLAHHIHYPTIRPYNHIFTLPPIFVKDPGRIDWFRRKLQPFEDKEIKVQGFAREWRREFESCRRDDDFIISAEHLSAAFFVEEAVQRLKEFVEPYFEKVTIIAYIRHYDSWIPSEVQQSIKNGFSARNDIFAMVQNLQNCPPLMSYQKSLQKWVNVFGREAVVVRPFNPRSFYRNSLLSDFFHACGLPADDISIPEIRTNESLSAHAVAFLHKYNQIYPLFVNGAVNSNRGLIRDGLPVQMYNKLPYEKFKLDLVYSPQQAQTLNEEIDYVNQFFAEGERFQHISPAEGQTRVPNADDIPVEFFVELINNYNRQIEGLRRRVHNQQVQNSFSGKRKAYIKKLLDMLRIPFLLRILERLPWLKRSLQTIAGRLTK
jgi:hypothetical protein